MALTPTPPSAYSMCSEAECQERQSSGEISVFESQWPPPTSNSTGGAPQQRRGIHKQSRRIVDPRYAMTKYRRSAAGVDTKNRTPPRSFEQLECCLSQLEYVLCYQQQPPSNSTEDKPFPKQALTGTVSFLEDRIRAIQVDLTVTQRPSAALQYRLVKCHVLVLYLLGHVKTYEAQFGQKALSAALTNYWDDPNDEQPQRDDEMLCFMALQQLCQYYHHGMDESSLSFILAYYRSNVDSTNRQLTNFPKFQWALHLVKLSAMGRPRSVLRQLAQLGQTTSTMDSGFWLDASESFAILCRCCVAPIIDILRFQTLEQYNKSYMKGEKVKVEEVARLLYFSSGSEAGDFAEKMAGLTRNREGNDKIVFKMGPAQKSDALGRDRPDEFVFGAHYWSDKTSLQEELQEREPPSAWDDSDPEDEDDNRGTKSAYEGTRTDAEGVLIPPPLLLYRVLRAEKL